MPDALFALPLLFAQDAGAAATPQSSLLSFLLPLAPVAVLFYLMILRPQQQQEKKRRDMIDAMKKNDRVVTAAGIYGTVVSVDGDKDRVVLRVDDDKGVRIECTRASVARVIDPSAEKGESKTA